MSKTYLDKTGATYLVSKIWGYVKTKMASWSGVISIGKDNKNGMSTSSVYMIGHDNKTNSTGDSWAFGQNLLTSANNQMVFGQYNYPSTAPFVFGNGIGTNARNNLLEIDNTAALFHPNSTTTGEYNLYLGYKTSANRVPTCSDLSSLIQIDESTGDLYITY